MLCAAASASGGLGHSRYRRRDHRRHLGSAASHTCRKTDLAPTRLQKKPVADVSEVGSRKMIRRAGPATGKLL